MVESSWTFKLGSCYAERFKIVLKHTTLSPIAGPIINLYKRWSVRVLLLLKYITLSTVHLTF